MERVILERLVSRKLILVSKSEHFEVLPMVDLERLFSRKLVLVLKTEHFEVLLMVE